MRCFAHRGFAGVHPENTLAAVRRAVDVGADVEVDVRRCGSGELVVVHDETVDRISDGGGRVRDLSLSALRALDVLDTGQGLPTLADVVAAVPPDRVLNVELKEPGLAADAATAVADADADVLVSSFEPAILRAVAQESDLPRALLCRDTTDAIGTARELGCRAVHPHHRHCTAEVVGTAHAADLAVNAWTVRSRETARRLKSAGVDGLISDAPSYCPG